MRARNFKDVLIGAFCENGTGSAKRIIGAIMIVGVMFCTIWSCVNYGMTDNNKSVIETEIITAGGLLGITSITNIWRKKTTIDENNADGNKEKED
jgi:hypothetical protein